MKFLFTTLFFGTILIIWGLSIIIQTIFGINFPLMRIIFSLVLIYAGITLIKGFLPTHNHNAQKNVFFAKDTESIKSVYSDYKVIFGSSTIDLSDGTLNQDEYTNLQIYSLFGNVTVILHPEIPTLINTTAVLSSVTFPDKTLLSLGQYNYTTHQNIQPRITIDIQAILSAVEIKK